MTEALINPEVCSECPAHVWANWPQDDTYDWVICECCGLAHMLRDDEYLWEGKILILEGA